MSEVISVREKLTEGAGVFLSIEVANKFGVSEAIFLSQLHYWTLHSKNKRDDYLWVYKTYEDWHQELHCLSASTIKKVVRNLEKQEVIVTTNKYNRMGIDKTKWYRINYEVFDALLNIQEPIDKKSPSKKQNMSDDEIKNEPPMGKGGLSDSQEISFEEIKDTRPADKKQQNNNHDITSLNYNHEITQETTTNNTINKSSAADFKQPSLINIPADICNAAQIIFNNVDNVIKTGLSLAVTLHGHEAVQKAIYQLAQTEHEEPLTTNDVHKLAEKIKSAS